jgi:2-oxoglutarate/2-oxoacid ferredoxin oxidoreductase subunit beta
MKQVFKRPETLIKTTNHFCPGCHHGTAHRLIAEAIDRFQISDSTVGVAGVGCGVFLYDYLALDVCEAPHGRAPAVATGLKRVHPENIVFTYQGDGDLAAIGMSEIIHTANRGENITVIFINNCVYGMTGGQMAPTTLSGHKTTTSPRGRDYAYDGYPIRMTEMLAALDGVAFAARVAVNKPATLNKARQAVNKAFEMQINKMGLSFVEILSACPTNWGMTPSESLHRIGVEVIPFYPLGIFKEKK